MVSATRYLGSLGTLFLIVVSTHMMTCIWYAAGLSSGFSSPCDPEDLESPFGFGIRDMDPDLLEKIGGEEECLLAPGNGGYEVQISGWVVRANYSQATALSTRYAESLYSVFKSKFAYQLRSITVQRPWF